MRVHTGRLTSSPTDLANFLSCRHKTELDVLAARGRIQRPMWVDPLAAVLRDRGLEHERMYIGSLQAAGLRVVDLTQAEGARLSDEAGAATTLTAMRDGVDVIVQAPILGLGWFGYADVLRRVEGPSALGPWHYEVHDTKLTRETRGGTILQLCVYSEVVAALQHRAPEFLRVVTPAANESCRVEDFSAFYRQLTRDYQLFLASRTGDDDVSGEYPQPNEHCEICRWWERCNARRRKDDHLSFVAGLGRGQQAEFEGRNVPTLEALAALPLPIEFKPRRGSRETCERVREQARVQKQQRDERRPIHEVLSIDDDFGLRLLPPPSPGDLFLDFEGDPFAREGGREYLAGLGRVGQDGAFEYQARWAFTDVDERRLFEWLIEELCDAVRADAGAHIYHYAPYEPSAIKRLMTRYATREMETDELLRGGRFVDLYAMVRRSIRAGVESYSIKRMEPLYGFVREVELERAGDQRRVVELALETGDPFSLTTEARAAVEGYNRDDCRSTLELRQWFEAIRQDLVARGTDLSRPIVPESQASEKTRARRARVDALRARLLALDDGPPGAATLLAHLIDWHDREEKVVWWEFFRLCDMAEEELTDEPAAVTGLAYVETVREVMHKSRGTPTGSVVDRYRFPAQEFEIRPGMAMKGVDGSAFGKTESVDRDARTIDILKGPSVRDQHPTALFTHDYVNADAAAEALFRFGEDVATHGVATGQGHRPARQLLANLSPTIGSLPLADVARLPGESETDFAVRIVPLLEGSVLPVQGPPGTGKTFTGARMICELVRRGRKVGVTATGHKVIRNLLDAVARQAKTENLPIRIGQRREAADGDIDTDIIGYGDNGGPLAALASSEVDVVGGTAWLWSRPEYLAAVDVLFVDEAGQMSLANVIAVSQAADSLVLLGDPQQLEQPQKGSHPDGVGVSALEHVLGAHQTISRERGIFLPVTWRLPPAVCDFTSEVFYENKLVARAETGSQAIEGSGEYDGAGLRVVEVDHSDCRNASAEEVAKVAAIVDRLLKPGVTWVNDRNERAAMTAADILVVAPYNAHVARLKDVLAPRGVAVGTVDRFQGQEAPVVIYSMATSRPEDAPRGMEFLYNLNRLNVATSRAKCISILVVNPRLFEPECRTPRQMHLANALCRFREMAEVFTVDDRPWPAGRV